MTLRTSRKSKIWISAVGVCKGHSVSIKIMGTDVLLWAGQIDKVEGRMARARVHYVGPVAHFLAPGGEFGGSGDIIDIDVTVTNELKEESHPVSSVAIVDAPG